MLKLSCLNVCGLISKLRFPEFTELINNHDIFVCLESKIDELDKLELPRGYQHFSKIRKGCIRKSGGITVIYKQSLSNIITFHESDCNYVQWMSIKNEHDSTNMLIGCIYIPPENSLYTSKDAFDDLEKEFMNFLGNYDKFALIGDFNARTSTLSDFIELDNDFYELIENDLDEEIREILYDHKKLVELNVPLKRYSEDKGRVNNYGHKLIDFCKRCNMYIVNGRLGADKEIGRNTSNESSLIDYFMVCSKMIKDIIEFKIESFDPLISDVHNRIYTSILTAPDKNPDEAKPDMENRKPRWIPDKKNNFIENVEQKESFIIELCTELDGFEPNNHNLDGLLTKLEIFFSDTAVESFGIQRQKIPQNKEKHNWFNKSCETKRRTFHKAKKKYNENKNNENKELLKTASRLYKKQMSETFAQHQLRLEKELRTTSKRNSKDFWKILNKFNRKSSKTPEIPLNALFDHFKKLNKDDQNNDNFVPPDFQPNDHDAVLNGKITETEVENVVKKLKNNKASGFDRITNEYIKSTIHICLPLYVKLFNFLLDSGIFPEKWSIGIINPIYKNKGDPKSPDNYRGITLISCLGKVYTAILNERLNNFADGIELITKAQAGFRKGYSTIDNIFCLYSLIQIYLMSNRKLFCTFVDFRKAFDTIWRVGLWQKLIQCNITGKIFTSIFKMYSNIKSCVRLNSTCSEFFDCQVGVRQGENLSPFLFAIFINDLEHFFIDNGVQCLDRITEFAHEHVNVFIKLFLLLYADDTILISETKQGMQRMLNVFDEYCTRWKLDVNIDKTKIIVFAKRKQRQNMLFSLNDKVIQITDYYQYLGIMFNYNCNFKVAKTKLVEQATKALFALNFKIRNISIPVDLQLKLFDCLVTPILLYSSEIWSHEKMEIIEKVHLNFLKRILNVRNSTPNYMVYGETGRFPLLINAKIKCLCYWSKLIQSGQSKLSGILYTIMYKLHQSNIVQFKWLSHVKSILDECGYYYMWPSQIAPNITEIKTVLKQKLLDNFYQEQFTVMEISSRGRFYSTIKRDFGLEKYQSVLSKADRLIYCKFRCANFKLPIEVGRWRNISYENRYCSLCDSLDVGNEYHYLFICKNHELVNLRKKYIPNYYIINPSIIKMNGLLSICNQKVTSKLCHFLRKLEKMFV